MHGKANGRCMHWNLMYLKLKYVNIPDTDKRSWWCVHEGQTHNAELLWPILYKLVSFNFLAVGAAWQNTIPNVAYKWHILSSHSFRDWLSRIKKQEDVMSWRVYSWFLTSFYFSVSTHAEKYWSHSLSLHPPKGSVPNHYCLYALDFNLGDTKSLMGTKTDLIGYIFSVLECCFNWVYLIIFLWYYYISNL